MRDPRIVVAAGVLTIVAAAACRSHAAPPPRQNMPPPPPFQRIVVAVLPFDNATPDMDAPVMLRQRVVERLGSRGYLLRSGAELDDDLRGMGITLGGQVKAVPPKDFRTRLRVDAVLSGTVYQASSLITGIYNRRTVEAELILTDVRTGSVIWTWRDTVRGEDKIALNATDLLHNAIRGAERANLSRETVTFSNIAVGHMPFCPREGEIAWGGQALPPPAPVVAPAPSPAPAQAAPN